MYSHLGRDELIAMLTKSQDRVTQMTENMRVNKLKMDLLAKQVGEFETKARHFDAMLKPIHENEVVKGAWDRFMMTLRMAGYE